MQSAKCVTTVNKRNGKKEKKKFLMWVHEPDLFDKDQ